MLTEMHGLGIPWKAWETPDHLLGTDLESYPAGLAPDDLLTYDPTYVDDFWNAAGYLGSEQSALGDPVRAELAEMGDTAATAGTSRNASLIATSFLLQTQGWIALDQFRKTDGSPLHPQRAVGEPGFSGAVSGNASFDGSNTGKMIVVSNLYDRDALPLHTDWHRKRVEQSLGAKASNAHRVYFTDHAYHQDAVPTGQRAATLVDWYGGIEQTPSCW